MVNSFLLTASTIPATNLALISQIKGYSYAQGQNVDAQRAHNRKGAKKAQPVPSSPHASNSNPTSHRGDATRK